MSTAGHVDITGSADSLNSYSLLHLFSTLCGMIDRSVPVYLVNLQYTTKLHLACLLRRDFSRGSDMVCTLVKYLLRMRVVDWSNAQASAAKKESILDLNKYIDQV